MVNYHNCESLLYPQMRLGINWFWHRDALRPGPFCRVHFKRTSHTFWGNVENVEPVESVQSVRTVRDKRGKRGPNVEKVENVEILRNLYKMKT